MKKVLALVFTLILGSVIFILLPQKAQLDTEALSENELVLENQNSALVKVDVSQESSWEKAILKIKKSLTSIKQTVQQEPPSSLNSKAEAQQKTVAPVIIEQESFSAKYEPLTDYEAQAITDITKSLSRVIALKQTSHQFMEAIRDSLKLKPKFLDEGTTSVGSLVTVRTHNSLEGTRYLHAQFTGEQGRADFLQHASFQIRPGPDSFSKAVETLNQVLPKTKKIKESSPDYILYNTGDGYVAWVKVANLDDLKANDYNKASAKDVGAVIVTIEQDIHSMDEVHGHSH